MTVKQGATSDLNISHKKTKKIRQGTEMLYGHFIKVTLNLYCSNIVYKLVILAVQLPPIEPDNCAVKLKVVLK